MYLCHKFTNMQKNHFLNWTILLLIGFFFTSCGSKKEIVYVPVRTEAITRNFYTDLIINYRLDKTGIRDTFNNAISDAFKANFDIPEYDIKMTLSKPKDAAVEIEGKSVLVVVPVTVNVEKKTFLADLKAKGTMEMSFITEVEIDSIWNMKTKTSLSYHRWIEKPKLSVAGLNLPIETISDAVIKRSKALIEKNIDDSVNESITLKQKMKETMVMFDQPLQMNPTMNAWINIKPEKIQINKVANSKFISTGKIAIHGLSTFTTYKPTANNISTNLPRVSWNENIPDSSVFRLIADIKMQDINPMIKANLDGKTFTSGDKSITLSNIITNCDYEHLRIVTDITGSVNGTLIIKGKPKYDAVNNEFYMDNIDIQLKTKNILHKAAAWIGEGKIRNEMESKMKFSINKTIEEVQKNIDTQLKVINNKYDLEMKIGIGSADVESFELKPGQIEAQMKSKFYLEVNIRNFRSFNKF